MTTKNDSPLQILESRQSLYDFLAVVYRREVDADLLRMIQKPGFLERLKERGYVFESECLGGLEEELIQKLVAEFNRLFGMLDFPLSPYESVYDPETFEKGTYCGEVREELDKAADLDALRSDDEGSGGKQHHISTQFEFMARLVEREIEHTKQAESKSADQCRRIQKHFYDNHLSVWVPLFCEKLIKRTRVYFYKQIGWLTLDFIRSEGEFLRNGPRFN